MTQQPLVGDWTCQDTFVEGWYEENMFCAGLYKSDNCVVRPSLLVYRVSGTSIKIFWAAKLI